MPTQNCNVRPTMCACWTPTLEACSQPLSSAQMEPSSNNKSSTVIGGKLINQYFCRWQRKSGGSTPSHTPTCPTPAPLISIPLIWVLCAPLPLIQLPKCTKALIFHLNSLIQQKGSRIPKGIKNSKSAQPFQPMK